MWLRHKTWEINVIIDTILTGQVIYPSNFSHTLSGICCDIKFAGEEFNKDEKHLFEGQIKQKYKVNPDHFYS